MSVRTALAIMFVAALTAWSSAIHPAFAQEGAARRAFKIKGLKLYARQAPSYSGTGTGDLGGEIPAANKPWLRIEVEFESEPEWADDVQLKYYVLMGKGREERLFVGEVTHVNIAKGAKHYSAMFLHPNVLERFGRGNVEKVAVQLLYRGAIVDTQSEPGTGGRWWEQKTPSPGFLLPPRQTPWAMLAHKRFEVEKMGP